MSLWTRLTFPLRALPDLGRLVVAYLPGPSGTRLRRWYWGRRLRALGDRAVIDVGVHIEHPEWVSIGDDAWIDRSVLLLAGPSLVARETRWRKPAALSPEPGEIRIGRRCHLAPGTHVLGAGGVSLADDVSLAAGCRVYSITHHYRSFARPADRTVAFSTAADPGQQCTILGPIVLLPNVGLGAGCVVLPGVTVGPCSFVRIGSVVASDLGENVLAAGHPAVPTGPRYDEPGSAP